MNRKFFVYLLLIIIVLFYFFYILGTTKITVFFKDLEPLKNNLPVYYNGFKLGRTVSVYPSKDYTLTMVDIRITTKNLHLPKNTSAILRRKDKKDYIELDYPQRPYIETLKHGDVIEGHLGVNFENFLQNQAENGGLDEIKNNVNQAIISAGDTFEALTMLLEVVTDILNDAKPEIQESVQNLNKTSKNLADTSFELKKTIQKGYLDKTLYNIEETSSNLVLTTKNTNSFTTSLDKESGFLINCLLKKLNVLVNNINHIVIGIGNTLSKKFGGLKVLFGKSMS